MVPNIDSPDVNLRIARALLATDMVALSTFGCVSDEQGLANMAGTANSLADRLPNKILTTCSRRDGENELLALGSHGLRLGLGLLSLLLGFRGRIAEALLAAKVVALGAKFVGTQTCQAAMAIATNTHTDRLVDTLNVVADGTEDPLVRLEGQAVLLEQSSGSLLLSATPFLGIGRGSGFLDRLLGSWFGTDRS